MQAVTKYIKHIHLEDLFHIAMANYNTDNIM